MTLLGLTYDKDLLLVQAYLLLKQRKIVIRQVKYIKTGIGFMDTSIVEFWKNENINPEISKIYSNGNVKSESDYAQLENELFLWYSSIKKTENNLYVFVGGGHTLLNLALQRCVYLFGATDSFHMLVDTPRNLEPKTIYEINSFITNNKIIYASFGSESGWPILSEIESTPNFHKIITQVTHNISNRRSVDINEHPFECINLLPSYAIQWLSGRLSETDKDFIHKLPKIELHCHLGGFATQGNLLNEVRNAADDSHSIGPIKTIPIDHQWPMIEYNISLDSYMKLGDNSGSYILKNTGCLKKQIKLIYGHLIEQNIKYAEIRCSPFNYENKIQNSFQVLETIQHEFENLMATSDILNYCHVNLIIIATRSEDNLSKSINENLNQAIEYQVHNEGKKCQVVGVDLAGFENIKTRAEIFESNFNSIHRAGIAVTIHAGENDESEGIWQAVFKLNARRLGHALNLFQDQKLLSSVVNRKIGVEMCPYANYQIYGFAPKLNCNIKYPLLQYLKAGVQVTVNTDNIGISSANLTDNFLLLKHLDPAITRLDVLQLIRNGLEQAFINNKHKNELIKKFNQEIFNLVYSHIHL